MRVIIAGSRLFPMYGITMQYHWHFDKTGNGPKTQGKRKIMCIHLMDCIEKSGFNIREVVSGECWGMDRLGEDWAKKNNIPINSKPANWDKYGKRAAFIRNEEMAEYGDVLICIHSDTNGSKHMVECMKKLNKPYYERVITDDEVRDSSSNLDL